MDDSRTFRLGPFVACLFLGRDREVSGFESIQILAIDFNLCLWFTVRYWLYLLLGWSVKNMTYLHKCLKCDKNTQLAPRHQREKTDSNGQTRSPRSSRHGIVHDGCRPEWPHNNCRSTSIYLRANTLSKEIQNTRQIPISSSPAAQRIRRMLVGGAARARMVSETPSEIPSVIPGRPGGRAELRPHLYFHAAGKLMVSLECFEDMRLAQHLVRILFVLPGTLE